MSTKTEHIGLHQWESTDPFLREDFNEDNRKIDEAVGEAAGKAERALAGVEGISYNIYNLLLQDYYEGKYTGYKKALIFDGFINADGLSERSPGTWLENQRLWYCGNTQLLPMEENFGTAAAYQMNGGSSHTRSWEVHGHGTITGVSLYISSAYSSYTITVSLTCGGASSEKWVTFARTDNVKQLDITLDKPLALTPGKTLTLTVKSNEQSYNITLYGAAAGDKFGCRLSGTEIQVPDGMCLSHPCELGGDYGAALAWVRYEGEPPALALKNQTGGRAEFALKGTRSALTMENEPCMEAEYEMTTAPDIPNSTAVVELDMAQDGIGSVYDYGIVFQ